MATDRASLDTGCTAKILTVINALEAAICCHVGRVCIGAGHSEPFSVDSGECGSDQYRECGLADDVNVFQCRCSLYIYTYIYMFSAVAQQYDSMQ